MNGPPHAGKDNVKHGRKMFSVWADFLLVIVSLFFKIVLFDDRKKGSSKGERVELSWKKDEAYISIELKEAEFIPE